MSATFFRMFDPIQLFSRKNALCLHGLFIAALN